MPLFSRGDSKGDRSIDSRWHKKARDVKRSVANVDILSEREKRTWDLDDPERRPTGKKVAQNWEYTKPLVRVNTPDDADGQVDARDDEAIRDSDQS